MKIEGDGCIITGPFLRFIWARGFRSAQARFCAFRGPTSYHRHKNKKRPRAHGYYQSTLVDFVHKLASRENIVATPVKNYDNSDVIETKS